MSVRGIGFYRGGVGLSLLCMSAQGGVGLCHKDPLGKRSPIMNMGPGTETPGRNMGPSSQTGSDIIQRPPCEQNDTQVFKTLPCPKLRLRAVISGHSFVI